MASGFTTTGSDFDGQFIRREFFNEGQLWAWGYNNYGQLGTNNTTDRSSPVQTVAWGLNWKTITCTTVTGSAGGIKTDGTLWLWGDNQWGQLGTGNTTTRSSPVQTVASGTNWKSVAMGQWSTGAIKTDGTLWMWGRNIYGQLGDNSTTQRNSPVQTIAGGTNWQQVSGGAGGSTAAIKTDGTLWLWGDNSYGQLGTNTAYDGRSSPVQTVSSGTNWKQVAGSQTMAAIKTDGTLWMWGYNIYGQLGTNDRTNRSSPVQTVAAGNNWKQVSGGKTSIMAIKTDGTLWGWGFNNYGQLGTNDRTNRSSPVQTVAGGTNWKQAFVNNSSVAIKTDGTLWTWGQNAFGGLGNGTTTGTSSPIQVGSLTTWQAASVTTYSTFAITTTK